MILRKANVSDARPIQIAVVVISATAPTRSAKLDAARTTSVQAANTASATSVSNAKPTQTAPPIPPDPCATPQEPVSAATPTATAPLLARTSVSIASASNAPKTAIVPPPPIPSATWSPILATTPRYRRNANLAEPTTLAPPTTVATNTVHKAAALFASGCAPKTANPTPIAPKAMFAAHASASIRVNPKPPGFAIPRIPSLTEAAETSLTLAAQRWSTKAKPVQPAISAALQGSMTLTATLTKAALAASPAALTTPILAPQATLAHAPQTSDAAATPLAKAQEAQAVKSPCALPA